MECQGLRRKNRPSAGNYWTADPRNVWVDSTGYLHLTIKKSGDRWLCTEIRSQEFFGYGTFEFTVKSRLDLLSAYSVLGLFAYASEKLPHQPEIDIEVANFPWSDCPEIPGSNQNLYYTLHLATGKEIPVVCKKLDLSGKDITRHRFTWYPNKIEFWSFQRTDSGYREILRGVRNQNISQPGMSARLNFWLRGKDTLPEADQEVIIQNMTFTPLSGAVPGKLTNRAATGDPWQIVSVAGFESYNGAFKFVENGFKWISPAPLPLFNGQIQKGTGYQFNGNPWVVFYTDVTTESTTQTVLLSITQCAGDLPNLNIGSWGAQFLLTS
ncbi:MAG TPA: hypothetical protein VGO50_19735 [Pyrinomonadaceae bacterium]|nr:hypothetical protein [Pyrinomonadaceae bacterium]